MSSTAARKSREAPTLFLFAIVGFGVSFVSIISIENATLPRSVTIASGKTRVSGKSEPKETVAICQDGFESEVASQGVEKVVRGHAFNDQAATDRLDSTTTLIHVSISPESRVRSSTGEAEAKLVHRQWTDFELSIENTAGVRSRLSMKSDQFMIDGADSLDRWLWAELVPDERLTGDRMELRKLRLWSRDQGKRAAVIEFNVGEGTQDLGFRSDVLMIFDIQ